MSQSKADPPADDDEPRNEEEFLVRQSQAARDALGRLRGQWTESLKNTADLPAWTRAYPWPILGTTAVASVAAGWALGRTIRRSPKETIVEPVEGSGASRAEEPHAAARLLGGLGTLAGLFGGAIASAASEAIADAVKNSLRDVLSSDAPKAQEAPDSQDTSEENSE